MSKKNRRQQAANKPKPEAVSGAAARPVQPAARENER